MTLDFSIQEKRVIYNILAQIMKADTIINSAEVRFLDEVFYNFNLSLQQTIIRYIYMEFLPVHSTNQYD